MTWEDSVRELGFAVIPEVLTPHETASVLETLSHAPLRRTRAGVRHALQHPAVAALAQHSHLMDIARGVLGSGAVPFGATLFDKSPGANWLVAWHQDTALPLQARRESSGWGPWSVKDGVNYAHAPASALNRILALRIHLDDSTARNGPLRVLPRTHTLGVLTDDSIHQLTTEVPSAECPVPIGGVIAMRPLVVHSSSKSQSDVPRRVLHIEYAASLEISEDLRLAIA